MKEYVHLRTCDCCGGGMDEGFYNEENALYYCGRVCLLKEHLIEDNPVWSITECSDDLQEGLGSWIFWTEWYEDDRWED